jgi:hypothetical protein
LQDNYAPIALFVYKRAEHAKATLEALLENEESKNSDLFIFSDAAKSDVDEAKVAEVRTVIDAISGFQSITVTKRDENFGLAKSIIDGVTFLTNKYGKVIVLEDDLVVSKHFLRYMNESLIRYESDERVHQIAGYMFDADLGISSTALFLPFTTSWGWATWDRAWQLFDESAGAFKTLKQSASLRKKFNLENNYPYYQMLEKQQLGKNDSWAIRWYLSVFMNNGLVLYPPKSLVKNIGFDGSGENCAISGYSENSFSNLLTVQNYPLKVVPFENIEKIYKVIAAPRFSFSSLIRRALSWVKR